MTPKEEKRRQCITVRNAIAAEVREIKSLKVCEKIAETDAYDKASVIYGYYPTRSEVDILPLLKRALADGKKVALPKCLDRQGYMEFYLVDSLDSMSRGCFGIYEPEGNSDPVSSDGIILVPGVAYDLSGNRMGYGGGYYDRYLGRADGSLRIGIAFDEQITSLTTEEYDQKMDMLITDEKIIRIARK